MALHRGDLNFLSSKLTTVLFFTGNLRFTLKLNSEGNIIGFHRDRDWVLNVYLGYTFIQCICSHA